MCELGCGMAHLCQSPTFLTDEPPGGVASHGCLAHLCLDVFAPPDLAFRHRRGERRMADEVSAMVMPPKSSLSRVMLASAIGSALEWYDFFIYGTAAALVFNELFFPKLDPRIGTLAAFATFGVGFFACP